MFNSLTPLSPKEHGNFRFTPFSDFNFAKSHHLIPLTLSETRPLCCELPIVFIGKENPTLSLVTGFDETEGNLFIDEEGHWQGHYVPALLKRYPFALMKISKEDHATEYAVAVDLESGCFSNPSGEPLFNEDGTPSELLKRQAAFLQTLENEMNQTAKMAHALQKMGVLSEAQITLKHNGSEKLIGGFQVVDRSKLMKLDDTVLAEWCRQGWYEAIVHHLLSLDKFGKLADAKDR